MTSVVPPSNICHRFSWLRLIKSLLDRELLSVLMFYLKDSERLVLRWPNDHVSMTSFSSCSAVSGSRSDRSADGDVRERTTVQAVHMHTTTCVDQ
mmetsp:Transcript_51150/g.76416  ORF Transcript_51150/g.76416 Transcript_51150/m.76416 type:complete len:95 (+) Transcript_51150:38-322(+)